MYRQGRAATISIPGHNRSASLTRHPVFTPIAQGGLAKVLYDAVNDPGRNKLQVVYVGPKPDLLRHEAQAIMTGEVGEDGIFYADELLLKCPTKYEEAVPEQSEG